MKTNQTAETETETLTIPAPAGTLAKIRACALALGITEVQALQGMFCLPGNSPSGSVSNLDAGLDWEDETSDERLGRALDIAKVSGDDWGMFSRLAEAVAR
jgi:hypothetical protein